MVPKTTDPLPTSRSLAATFRFTLGLMGASLVFAGCGSDGDGSGDGNAETDDAADTDDDAADTGGPGPRPARVVVTADWLNGTISVLDYDALVEGATTRDEALWKEIDLSAYPPGPYQVELTPDGKYALVASASGFFSGGVGALLGASGSPGGGSVLMVDLDTDEVIHEFETPQPPMGLEISADGTTAYSANYGDNDVNGNTMTVLDLTNGTVVESITVGGRPEQIDLSPDGSLGVINVAADGTVVLFETDDPANTLGTPVMTSSDPSWPFFLEDGSGRIMVTDSMTPTGASIVDASDPANPTVIEQLTLTSVPYAGAPFEDGSGALVVTTSFSSIDIHRIDTTGASASLAWTVSVAEVGGFPLGVSIDEADDVAFIPVPSGSSGDALVVMNLEDQSYTVIEWMDAVGPTYVALQP